MNYKIYDNYKTNEYMNQYQMGHLCASVLAAKELTEEQIQEVLNPPKLMNPFFASGLKEVVDRLLQAKTNQEKVLVCGDYDADGICATAILYQSLCKAGITCGYYIPNRFKEGYGLHPNTVVMAKDKGYSLLITVDNGVKAFAAADKADELGIELIITDHHGFDELPKCSMLLHPQQMGKDFETLSGAGVAFELSRALIGDDEDILVLACVASIGDVMSLWHETRSIVRLGLQALNRGACMPIQKLANSVGSWDEMKVSFQIVPKLNVTGRLADMANANMTVRYLLSTSRDEILNCSKQINELNDLRKIKSEEMARKAMGLVNEDYAFQVLYDDSFHEGLTGLVAGKLANQLQRPVMVLSGTETLKGSIRSYGDLNLNTFFQESLDIFDAYGGHPKAAGLGFAFDQLKTVRHYVNDTMSQQIIHDEETVGYLPLKEVDLTVGQVQELQRLAPFGEGFTPMLFSYPFVEGMKVTAMSQGKHLKWSNDQLDILYFNCESEVMNLKKRKDITFYGTLSISTFRNVSKITLMVSDIQ